MTTATEDTLSNPLNFLALTVLPAVGSSKTILGVGLGFPHLKGKCTYGSWRCGWSGTPRSTR